MTCKRNGAVTVAWRLLVRYSVDLRVQRRLNSDRRQEFWDFLGSRRTWWEQGCFATPWVERRRLLSESQSSSSERRRTHGTPKMNSWRFFLKARRHQRWWDDNDQPQARWCFTNNNLSRLHLFCLLVNDPRSYNHVQGDDMRDSNPTFSCCLARVAIPCQVQQPGTAPPSGSKLSFFPLLFLPLLIEEQRWNLEQQISEV